MGAFSLPNRRIRSVFTILRLFTVIYYSSHKVIWVGLLPPRAPRTLGLLVATVFKLLVPFSSIPKEFSHFPVQSNIVKSLGMHL